MLNFFLSPPPSFQADLPRWSLVFFTRPGNGQILRALTDESPIIRNAIETKRAQGEDVSVRLSPSPSVLSY